MTAQGRRDAERRVTADPAPAFADALLASYRRSVESVVAVEPQIRAAASRLAEIWERGGRCIYLGAGAAGLIAAEDAAELPGTFGLDRQRLPVVLAGGESAWIGVDAATEDGAFLVAIANRPGAPLLAEADVPLLLDIGVEALQGSTRLAAGVAQKCALGMISTLFGLALGHVHAGLMVNLRADNDKLVRRAVGIVMTLSGVDERQAQAALAAADGEVKQAVLLSSGARDCDDAANLLTRSRGRLAEALENLRKELGRGAAD